jgi:hypothetical protein
VNIPLHLDRHYATRNRYEWQGGSKSPARLSILPVQPALLEPVLFNRKLPIQGKVLFVRVFRIMTDFNTTSAFFHVTGEGLVPVTNNYPYRLLSENATVKPDTILLE